MTEAMKYTTEAPPPQTEKKSEVSKQLNSLDTSIASLGVVIEDLILRIEPILDTSKNDPMATEEDATPTVKLAAEIREKRKKVNRLQYLVEGILRSLEL